MASPCDASRYDIMASLSYDAGRLSDTRGLLACKIGVDYSHNRSREARAHGLACILRNG